MKSSTKNFCIVIAGLFLGLSFANAIPTGPLYPPPGGVTLSTSGAASAADAGGKNFSFSNLNSSSFSDLYWGLAAPATAGFDGNVDTLSFVQVLGSTAIWQTTSSWFDPANSVNYPSVTIQLQITLNGGPSWVSASSLGLSSSLGVVANVSSGQNFSANVRFLGDGPNGSGIGITALDNFEGTNDSSFSGGFYYDPPRSASVPDSGATITLLGMVVAGLAVWRRRT
jgi:hypothetical protein